jgi:alcohol dehydrogenase class IV
MVGGVAEVFSVAGEPTIALVLAATEQARAMNCDVVVGLGGGSAIDAAKAVAALITNRGDILDYLEVIGRGQPLTEMPVPCVAIPTTAGTGSEVTRNAVLTASERQVKVSLRNAMMIPRVALVDPELALGLPREITASTGCDALAQLIEPFESSRANPLTDGICREGLARVARSLRRVCADGSDLAAREDMAIASLFGGLALANAGLGAVHALASPIGGRFDAPHGAVCGILLAPAMEINVAAIRASGGSLARFDEVGRILTGDPAADAAAGVAWVRELVMQLGIPRLGHYGIEQEDAVRLGEVARATSSMKSNPVPLTATQLAKIVLAAL